MDCVLLSIYKMEDVTGHWSEKQLIIIRELSLLYSWWTNDSSVPVIRWCFSSLMIRSYAKFPRELMQEDWLLSVGEEKDRRVGTEDGSGAWRCSVVSVAARQRIQRLRRISAGSDQAVPKSDACVSFPFDGMAAASSGSGTSAEPSPAEHAGTASGRCRGGQVPQSSSSPSSPSVTEQSFPTGDHRTSFQRTSLASCDRSRRWGWWKERSVDVW